LTKPTSLKECPLCDKLPISHTVRELHEHYGYDYLIKFIENRSELVDTTLLTKLKSYLVMVESEKMVDEFYFPDSIDGDSKNTKRGNGI
jgi:hypothetical protein